MYYMQNLEYEYDDDNNNIQEVSYHFYTSCLNLKSQEITYLNLDLIIRLIAQVFLILLILIKSQYLLTFFLFLLSFFLSQTSL